MVRGSAELMLFRELLGRFQWFEFGRRLVNFLFSGSISPFF